MSARRGVAPRYWTPDEEERLATLRGVEGLSPAQIGRMMNRTEHSVYAKMKRIGIDLPEGWKRARSFTLSSAKVAILRKHWLSGVQISVAADSVRTSEGTAARYYHDFADQARDAVSSANMGTYIGASEMMAIVAPVCGVPAKAIAGPTRIKPNVCARMAITKALRDRGVSYPKIGKLLGGRYHSSILNYMRKYDSYAVIYPEARRAYEAIKAAEARAAEKLAA